MEPNSILGSERIPQIAAAKTAGLERLCKVPRNGEGIVQAPASRGIERIEANLFNHSFEPHRHDTYALGVTLAGVQTFRYRGVSRFSLPGNVIVLHPDEVHDGAAGTEFGLNYRMLYLPPERLVEAAGKFRSLPFVANPVVWDESLRLCLAEALGELETELGELLLDDVITRLTEGLRRSAGHGEQRSDLTPVKSILMCRDFLQDNCDRVVSSGELETISGLDRYNIARQFRRVLGTSPHRYLLMRRLDKAKKGLLKGLSLADVAANTGFADQAHFTRHFKKTFGMTPGRWRELTSANW